MPKINKGWFKPGHKLNVESDNPIWKGDKVGYIALHEWVRTHLPKPELCPDCRITPPRDLANISQCLAK